MPSTMVVGFNGSEGARAALDQALALAKDSGDSVVAAFGYDPPGPGEERRAHRKLTRELGEQVMAEAVEQAATAGAEVEVALVAERPADALISIADERDARAIVIGSSGDLTVAGKLLGMNARKLLRASGRPILVVPPPST
jgi:nucleotide-binding universal stress UspA family protein